MGGRPRTPTKILELRGGLKNRPGRAAARANEPEPEEGLGDPPDYFQESDRARWAELVRIVPAGVLTQMDRPAAEELCKLWTQSRENRISSADRKLLVSLFGKFGLTPSERSKVGGLGAGKKKPENPFRRLG